MALFHTCRNITILGNTLANNNYAPIIVTSAVNVTVGDNLIQNALCEMPSIGQGYRWNSLCLLAMSGLNPKSRLPALRSLSTRIARVSP